MSTQQVDEAPAGEVSKASAVGACLGVAVSGLALVLSGLSFMLQAAHNDERISWQMLFVLAGALVCATGGYLAGRESRKGK